MRNMKFLKGLGGVLCFIGCLAALAGILATAAPMMDNDQVRRILESFSVPTRDVVVQTVNNLFLLCLKQNYWLFGMGVGVLLLGGLMRMYAERTLLAGAPDARPEDQAPIRRATPPKAHAKRIPTGIAAVPIGMAQPESAPVKPAELSPYAAAAFGNALSGHAYGSGSSIAEKYMPRSIINTPEQSLDDTLETCQANPADMEAKAAYPFTSKSDPADKTPQAAQTAWVPPAADVNRYIETEIYMPSPRTAPVEPSVRPTEPARPAASEDNQICPDCATSCDAADLYCPTCGCRLSKVGMASAFSGQKTNHASDRQSTGSSGANVSGSTEPESIPVYASVPQTASVFPVAAPTVPSAYPTYISQSSTTQSPFESELPSYEVQQTVVPTRPLPPDTVQQAVTPARPLSQDAAQWAVPSTRPVVQDTAQRAATPSYPLPPDTVTLPPMVSRHSRAHIVSTIHPTVAMPEPNRQEVPSPAPAPQAYIPTVSVQTTPEHSSIPDPVPVSQPFTHQMDVSGWDADASSGWAAMSAPDREPDTIQASPERFSTGAGRATIPTEVTAVSPAQLPAVHSDANASEPLTTNAYRQAEPAASKPRIVSTMRKKNP